MANIGNIAVKIVADAVGVQAGVDMACKALDGLKSKAAEVAASVGGYFKGGVIGTAANLFSDAMSLASSAVSTLTSKFADLSPKIADSYKIAQQLGTSVSNVMGFDAMGGEDFVHALQKFRQHDGTGDLVEGLAAFADQLKAIESPADRAAMAVEKLGKSGVSQLHLLQQGGEAVRAALQKYRDIGYTLSDEDAARVSAARRAMKDVGLMWEGAWNKLVVGVAPAMEAIAANWLRMAPTISAIAERIGVVLGESIKAASLFVRVLVEDVLKLGDVFGVGNGKAGEMMGSLEDWTKGVRAGLKEVAMAFGTMFDHIRNAMGPFLRSLGLAVEAMERIKGFIPGVGVLVDLNAMPDSAGLALRNLAAQFGKVVIGETAAAIAARWDEGMKDVARSKIPTAFADSSRIGYTPVAAMQENSKEAASVLARWKTELANPTLDVAKKQLVELQDINRKTGRQMRYFENGVEKFEVIDS